MTRQKRQAAPGSLSVADYARHRGVAKSAVQKAIATGRLSKSVARGAKNRVIGVFAELADREWEANTDRGRAPLPSATSEFQAARTRNEQAKAQAAELSLRMKQGELVDAAEMRKYLLDVFTRCRTKLLGIASRVRQQLPHLSTGDVTVLDQLVREALEDLANEGTET